MKSSRLSGVRGLALVAVLGFGLTLSACSDYTSPQGVLGTAFSALKKEKVKAFKRTLTGAAEEQYGTLVGMGALAAEIQGLELSVGSVTMTKSVQDFRGRDIYQAYAVKVLAREQAAQTSVNGSGDEVSTGTYRTFKDATVECRISYVRVSNDPFCDVPGPIYRCAGTYPRSYVEKQVTCLISSLAAPTLD